MIEVKPFSSFSRWFNRQGEESSAFYKKRISAAGAQFRKIGEGDPLSRIFSITALGLRLPHPPSIAGLTEKEIEAAKRGKIFTITDFDGVVTDPLGSALKAFFNGTSPKEEGRIPFSNLRWLRQLAGLSDQTVVCTSRFMILDWAAKRPPFNFFQGGIMYFPFLNSRSVEAIRRLAGEGKISVVANKSILHPGRQIRQVISWLENDGAGGPPRVYYYIGSSDRDRRAALKCLTNNPSMASRFIFIDTGHWKI